MLMEKPLESTACKRETNMRWR